LFTLHTCPVLSAHDPESSHHSPVSPSMIPDRVPATLPQPSTFSQAGARLLLLHQRHPLQQRAVPVAAGDGGCAASTSLAAAAPASPSSGCITSVSTGSLLSSGSAPAAAAAAAAKASSTPGSKLPLLQLLVLEAPLSAAALAPNLLQTSSPGASPGLPCSCLTHP
jgi:hypothetical protein